MCQEKELTHTTMVHWRPNPTIYSHTIVLELNIEWTIYKIKSKNFINCYHTKLTLQFIW